MKHKIELSKEEVSMLIVSMITHQYECENEKYCDMLEELKDKLKSYRSKYLGGNNYEV